VRVIFRRSRPTLVEVAAELLRLLVALRTRWTPPVADNQHLMQDAVRIAAIRHHRRKPPAHTNLALRRAQKQQAAIGGLGAAVEIYCEFLAADGWQIEGERRIAGHGGCGVGLMGARQCDWTLICYVNRPLRATAAAKFLRLMHKFGLERESIYSSIGGYVEAILGCNQRLKMMKARHYKI